MERSSYDMHEEMFLSMFMNKDPVPLDQAKVAEKPD